MQTLHDVAIRALRMLRVLEGDEVSDASDYAVARDVTLDVVARLPAYGAGRVLVDYETEVSLSVLDDTRLFVSVSGLTISLERAPKDGARFGLFLGAGQTAKIDPGLRLFEGAPGIADVSASATWFYDAETGNWSKVTDLLDTSNIPYPKSLHLSLAAVVAMELAAEMQASITPELGVQITKAERQLSARFARPREQDWGQAVPMSVRGAGTLRKH